MALAIFLSLLFFYSLVSRRLEQTIFTGPILFTVAGMLLFLAWPGILVAGINEEVLFRLSEIGLVLLLFTDASHADLNLLRRIGNLPARLLSIGMLLTIVLGAVTARLIFPQLSTWEAGILSTVLAPTDAGLGQVIVESPQVPMSIRQALNVEAGLNDGLSVPFLMFFIALAAAKVEGPAASLLQFIVEQLGYGVLVGGGIGLAGGWLLGLADLFLFGLVAMRALPQFDLALVLYAVLSLTVVRMLPVAIALAGPRLSLASVIFMGWFGPRGLASIVLGLVYLQQELQLPGETTIRLALIVTVLLSIFAHGLSASPGISIYARKLPPVATDAAGSPPTSSSR
jgi:NhaP-type Na+/H+ or K+/H+ antiporter